MSATPAYLWAYHWSPSDRRDSIETHGLQIGSPRTTRMEDWDCPWLSFAPTPSEAWMLSGATLDQGRRWDLWQVMLDVGDVERVGEEIRTRTPVERGLVRYVGSRDRDSMSNAPLRTCDHETHFATSCPELNPRPSRWRTGVRPAFGFGGRPFRGAISAAEESS